MIWALLFACGMSERAPVTLPASPEKEPEPATVQVIRGCAGISEVRSMEVLSARDRSIYESVASAQAYHAIALAHRQAGSIDRALLCAQMGVDQLRFSLDIDDRGIKPQPPPVVQSTEEKLPLVLETLERRIWQYEHIILKERL